MTWPGLPWASSVSYTHLDVYKRQRLVNGALLRDELAGQGAIFQTDTDSELLGHLVARQNNPCLEEAVAAVAPRLEGAFAFILSDGKKIIGLRDRHGFRPLSLGRLGDCLLYTSRCV